MKTQTSSLELSHFPVMLSEIIEISNPAKGGFFIDCTFGGGNYTKALLKFSKTEVVSFDRDSSVISIAKKLEQKFKKRFKFYNLKFSQINTVLAKEADAIIFDLGMSSIQLNNLQRGFSFKSKDKLDMSMGLTDISAEEVINKFSEIELKLIIKIFGEEKEASKIARNIVESRKFEKITRVDELVKIIEKSKKKNFSKKINPSTKTFQALRIFVNKEISELLNGIINATKMLKPGGKILIISFHSIEDKIVKYYFFSNFSKNKSRPSRYLPDTKNDKLFLFEKYNKKIIKPSQNEININKSFSICKIKICYKKQKSI